MHINHSTRMTLAAALAIVLLAACSADDDTATTAAPATSAGASQPAASPGSEEQDVCALLTPAEIEAAFDGAFQVVVDSGSDRVCSYSIVGHEGELLLQPMDAWTYDGRKTAYSQGNYGDLEPVAVPGLGQDAYMMGDAQIEVLVNDQEGFNLAVQLFAVGELPFTPEQSRSAMAELAATVAQRL